LGGATQAAALNPYLDCDLVAGPFGDAVGRSFKHGYLTKQNALWAALGINIGLGQRFSPVQQVWAHWPSGAGTAADQGSRPLWAAACSA